MAYENCVVENKTFDEERAFYGARNVKVKNVSIDGPADGESAFKECRDVECKDCFLICVIRFGTTIILQSRTAR